MRRINLRITGYFLAVLPMLAVGCGTSRTDVTGQVRFKGKALESGSVTFFCQNKQIASGLIGPDGSYRISDVPLGPAVVTVRSHPRVPEGFREKHKLPPSKDAPRPVGQLAATELAYVPVPERFHHPDESGLSFVISANKTVFNIDLKP